ncbi:hypothetical protein [Caenimonas soli]|uniref:hypothetical protein n=1 Tax=Caenimonas soli TaxID=2735555 RepID=UPI001555B279|nr:hypothetical protein [Caenimonas soli]NPC58473.1 hypothetical protein [Caenimonas soli]
MTVSIAFTASPPLLGTGSESASSSALPNGSPQHVGVEIVNLRALNVDACVAKYTAAHRKQVGEEALIRADQIEEWATWCRQGKQPS